MVLRCNSDERSVAVGAVGASRGRSLVTPIFITATPVSPAVPWRHMARPADMDPRSSLKDDSAFASPRTSASKQDILKLRRDIENVAASLQVASEAVSASESAVRRASSQARAHTRPLSSRRRSRSRAARLAFNKLISPFPTVPAQNASPSPSSATGSPGRQSAASHRGGDFSWGDVDPAVEDALRQCSAQRMMCSVLEQEVKRLQILVHKQEAS